MARLVSHVGKGMTSAAFLFIELYESDHHDLADKASKANDLLAEAYTLLWEIQEELVRRW